MDKFAITGGTTAPRGDPRQRVEELGAARAGRGAADRRAGDPEAHSARAGYPDYRAAAGGYRIEGGGAGRDGAAPYAPDRLSRSAVRIGEDHARLEPGAGAAGGPLRARARFAAGRLRHRGAAHQPAHFRAGTAWRAHPPGARLHRSRRPGRPSRRGGPLRPDHRHGHRGPHDGGRAGQGRDHAAQRGARAGGGRPGRVARQDGGAASKARALPPSGFRAWSGCTAPSTPSFRTASRRERS